MHRCATVLDNVTVTSALVLPTVHSLEPEAVTIATQHLLRQLVRKKMDIVFLCCLLSFALPLYLHSGEHREFNYWCAG